GLGVREPVIQTHGSNQILVELPGVQDPEQAVQLLRETALLEIVSSGQTSLPVGQTITTTLGGPAKPQSLAGSQHAATPADAGTPAAAGAAATPAAAPTPSPATPTGPTYE